MTGASAGLPPPPVPGPPPVLPRPAEPREAGAGGRRQRLLPITVLVLSALLLTTCGVVVAKLRGEDVPAAVSTPTPDASVPGGFPPGAHDAPPPTPAPTAASRTPRGSTPAPTARRRTTAPTAAPRTAAPNADEVVVDVGGDGPATVALFRSDAGVERFTRQRLPWRFTFLPGQESVAVRVEAARATRGPGRLTCRIAQGGATRVERKVSGGNAKVSCFDLIRR